jgi:cell shape-determining protein MreC
MFTFNSTHKKLLAEKNELKREYDKLKKENDEQKARLKVITH